MLSLCEHGPACPDPGRPHPPARRPSGLAGPRIGPLDDAVLRADLESLPHGSLFSSGRWLRALGAGYGLDVRASVIEFSGRATAALLFVAVDDLRGRRVLSLPFSDYCDPLVDQPDDWRRLVEPLMALEAPVRLRCLHNRLPLADRRFAATGLALWHATDLTRAEPAIWNGLDPSARQNIRRAERHGIRIREGTSIDDLRAFHAMHRAVRKSKYRMLAQPEAFFESLHAEFAPSGSLTVLLAELDGEPVAGILLLEHRDTLYYKFNASIDQRFRPNDLLAWHGMLLGRRRGLKVLDFGLSDPAQDGLVRYKRKFATSEQPISQLEWRPDGYVDPRGTEVGRTLKALTDLLTEPSVPDDITRRAGNEIYRFFC